MSEVVETVKVKCQKTQENPEGFCLVNKSDVVEGMEVISDTPEPEPESKDSTIRLKK